MSQALRLSPLALSGFSLGTIVEKSNYETSSFRPPCFGPTKDAKPTSASSKRRTPWTLLGLIALLVIVHGLSGCASSLKVESDKPLPISAELSAKQSPVAKDYSEKVSSYLGKVERYFSETPTFTTP